MSEMERNKGKLIPTEMTEEIAMKLVNDRGEGLDGYETYLEKFEDFHTYHYNGGGYWTEVVEAQLKKISK